MENQRGCFFNHLFKGFLVGFFSSKNKMCIEQRYACYSYRRCKSKHLEGAVRLPSHAVKTQIFFSCALLRCLLFLILRASVAPINSDATRQLSFTLPTRTRIHTRSRTHTHAHTHTHTLPPPPFIFQLQYSACVILFYLTSPPPSVPSGVHFSTVDPTIPQPRT